MEKKTLLLINIDPALKERFRQSCSMAGQTMTDSLLSHIEAIAKEKPPVTTGGPKK
jgi:hypothetical protein